jgi:hypothetical protein
VDGGFADFERNAVKTFCSGCRTDLEYEQAICAMITGDVGLFNDVLNLKYIGGDSWLGYVYHLRSLVRMKELELGVADEIRTEMELLVGKRIGNTTNLYTPKDAFRAVVKKHFSPYKGSFIHISDVIELARGGETIFLK